MMMTITRKIFLLLMAALFTCSCDSANQTTVSENSVLPTEIKIPDESIDMLTSIVTLKDPQDYFPSQSKMTKTDIHSPAQAYNQLLKLYPEKGKQVECWTEFNGYYVFSLRVSNDIKNAYLAILYVKKGGRKFMYFWPHT